MKWLRDLGAILKVGCGGMFGVGLCILIADAFVVLPLFLSNNAFNFIMVGIMGLMGGYGIEAVFGE